MRRQAYYYAVIFAFLGFGLLMTGWLTAGAFCNIVAMLFLLLYLWR